MTDELGSVILERTFESQDANGVSGTIKLRLGIPYMISDSGSSLKWRCPYQIIGNGSEKINVIRGIDAIDALLMSLRIAEAFLKSYSKIKITWLGEEELGLSFSFPNGTSDLDFETNDSFFQEIFDDFFARFAQQIHQKSLWKRRDARACISAGLSGL